MSFSTHDVWERDDAEGPLSAVRRFLSKRCNHNGRCLSVIERVFAADHVLDDSEHFIVANYSIRYELPRVDTDLVGCLEDAATLIRLVREDRWERAGRAQSFGGANG